MRTADAAVPLEYPPGGEGAASLEADRALLGRTSRAELLADVLRARIAAGYFRPGTRLTEKTIQDALGISRNTLREAFRLLTHERLLVHELDRGMFVRRLTVEDVADIYRVRKLVECAAVSSAGESPRGLHDVATAVLAGEQALEARDWQALGTANIAFHQALAALAASPRINELMRGVLAELRLVFHVMADPRRFHEPYLTRNREILTRLEANDPTEAARLLAKYLDAAEDQLVAAYRERTTQPPSSGREMR